MLRGYRLPPEKSHLFGDLRAALESLQISYDVWDYRAITNPELGLPIEIGCSDPQRAEEFYSTILAIVQSPPVAESPPPA